MVYWKPLFPSAEQQNPIQWTACFRHPPVPNLACWRNQLRHFLAYLTQTWSIDRGELSFYFYVFKSWKTKSPLNVKFSSLPSWNLCRFSLISFEKQGWISVPLGVNLFIIKETTLKGVYSLILSSHAIDCD